MRFTSLFLLPLLFVALGCQEQDSEGLISSERSYGVHNGREATLADYNSVVAIGFLNQHSVYRHLCTGTVISSQWILTAAHCAEDFDKDDAIVLFGEDVKKSPLAIRNIKKWIVHPNWDPTSMDNSNAQNTHDLALIQFEGDLPEGFSAAKLIPPQQTLKINDVFAIAGFGYAEEPFWNGDEFTGKMPWGEGVLRTTNLSVADDFSDTELLVDEHTTGSTYGDSGGPAFVTLENETYLWGVTSRGLYRIDGIYTKINSFLPWINEQINPAPEVKE